MRRMIRYSNLGAVIGEVHPNDVMALVRKEEINGEHSLEITTTQVLGKNERIIFQDGRGYWREYVVTGIDEAHADGRRVIGTYYCTWSLQADMLGVTVSKMPGTQSPVSAGNALDAIISEQGRWTRGTVTQTTTGGASMYDMSAWKALGVLIDNWGGEIGTTITVDTLSGVTGRAIDLYAQMGQATATRRFDFGADLRSVRRTIPDDPLYCRISPRGKGEETEGGGYGRKIRITEVNGGKDYLEYAPMVDVAKLPAGSGWLYPTLIVENSDMETPADLKAWAQGILEETLTPKVTYEVDVVQAGVEGVDFTGVSLGDVVHVVDRYFTDEGLRLEGRVTSIIVDELNEHNVKVKIGYLGGSFADNFARLQSAAQAAYDRVTELSQTLSTAEYISSLLDRINAEVNATGGYTYITEGQGIRTYDVAVSDPLVGAEASQVVEVKGGTIRIANTKTSGGAWEWKTLLQSGFIAADLINAINVKAGRIESADGSSYWDLDNGGMQLSGSLVLTLANWADYYGQKVTASLSDETISKSYSFGTNAAFKGLAVKLQKASGRLPISVLMGLVRPSGSTATYPTLFSEEQMVTVAATDGTHEGALIAYYGHAMLQHAKIGGQRVYLSVDSRQSWVFNFNYTPAGGGGFSYANVSGTSSSNRKTQVYGTLAVIGNLTVTGTKPRLVETPHYADRLLYAYETPAPYFGDIGSATIDEDGTCYIALDDIFAETVNVRMGYQVFLQKCGPGDLWISEKSSAYFVVQGTPGLAFDWEIKAHQRDYENTRTECNSMDEFANDALAYDESIYDSYSEDLSYVDELERIAYEAA